MREIILESVARNSRTVFPRYSMAAGLNKPVLDHAGPGSRTGLSLRRSALIEICALASCATSRTKELDFSMRIPRLGSDRRCKHRHRPLLPHGASVLPLRHPLG